MAKKRNFLSRWKNMFSLTEILEEFYFFLYFICDRYLIFWFKSLFVLSTRKPLSTLKEFFPFDNTKMTPYRNLQISTYKNLGTYKSQNHLTETKEKINIHKIENDKKCLKSTQLLNILFFPLYWQIIISIYLFFVLILSKL